MTRRLVASNSLLPGLQRADARETDLIQLINSSWWYGPGSLSQPPTAEEQARSYALCSDSRRASVDVDEQPPLPPGRRVPQRPSPSSTTDKAAVQQQQRQHEAATSSQQEEAQVPGMQLGTWAARQRVFAEHLRPQELDQHTVRAENAGRPPPGSSASMAEAPPSPSQQHEQARQAAAQQADVPHASSPPQRIPGNRTPPPINRQVSNASMESDSELHAAWRWRFTRKWQMEQAKQLDPDYGKDEEDDYEAALKYMDAVGHAGLNLQIARTVSVGGNDMSGVERTLSMLSPSLSQGMLLEGSVRETPLADTADPSATKHIQQMAHRAQQMMKHQQEIERHVSEQWSAAGGAAGAAASAGPLTGVLAAVPAFQLDSWGSFAFVLVRISDRQGRHKLVVRGKNGLQEGQLFRGLEQEVSATAVRQRQPGPRLELLGSGLMEWSRDRDRCLRVTGGRVHSLSDTRLQGHQDVALLAGAIAQSSLPQSFTVEYVRRNGAS